MSSDIISFADRAKTPATERLGDISETAPRSLHRLLDRAVRAGASIDDLTSVIQEAIPDPEAQRQDRERRERAAEAIQHPHGLAYLCLGKDFFFRIFRAYSGLKLLDVLRAMKEPIEASLVCQKAEYRYGPAIENFPEWKFSITSDRTNAFHLSLTDDSQTTHCQFRVEEAGEYTHCGYVIDCPDHSHRHTDQMGWSIAYVFGYGWRCTIDTPERELIVGSDRSRRMGSSGYGELSWEVPELKLREKIWR